MGKKFIITESQERILTRLVERELGPEESVFVVNKNPFKDEEYKWARREYSTDLGTGELFYVLNREGACDFIANENLAKINDLVPKLKGKSFRYSDQIYFIKDIWFSLNNKGNIVVYSQLKKTSDGPLVSYSGTIGSIYPSSFGTMSIATSDTFSESEIWVKSSSTGESVQIPIAKANGSPVELLNRTFCDRNRIGGLRNVPDEFFEIRKIERVKTDL